VEQGYGRKAGLDSRYPYVMLIFCPQQLIQYPFKCNFTCPEPATLQIKIRWKLPRAWLVPWHSSVDVARVVVSPSKGTCTGRPGTAVKAANATSVRFQAKVAHRQGSSNFAVTRVTRVLVPVPEWDSSRPDNLLCAVPRRRKQGPGLRIAPHLYQLHRLMERCAGVLGAAFPLAPAPRPILQCRVECCNHVEDCAERKS
jgi:hypothetical protein